MKIPDTIQQQAAYWLPVCPVHLIADRDTLVLAPTHGLGLSKTEADALIHAFNQHFIDEGYVLWCATATEWYLGSSRQWRLNFPRLEQAEATNCRDAWQKGKDAQAWRKLLNEVQMLWFSHDTNQQREQQGLLPINGLWVMLSLPWWRRWFV